MRKRVTYRHCDWPKCWCHSEFIKVFETTPPSDEIYMVEDDHDGMWRVDKALIHTHTRPKRTRWDIIRA